MPYRPFVHYDAEEQYLEHFIKHYCASPTKTPDDIDVRFYPDRFRHAFYEGEWKSQFSAERAERIDWIGEALRDPLAGVYVGWDARTNRLDYRRRVAIVDGNYVVVVEALTGKPKRGIFVTAYIATSWTVRLIKQGPRWSA